jgi:hypothetical protein
MQRRQFLIVSACAGAWPAASLASPGSSVLTLVDTRFAESRRYGDRAALKGQTVRRYHGDLTSLWQDVLLPHWQKQATVVQGLTTERGLLCLEQLAADHHWRVVSRQRAGAGLVRWSMTPGANV